MKKLIFSLFSIFILLALPLQANEIDMSILNDLEIPKIVDPDDRKEITGKASEIVVLDTPYARCSGSMVASNIVLTAAHCLIDEKGNYVKEINVYAVGLPPAFQDPLSKSKLADDTIFKKMKYSDIYYYATAKDLWVPDQYIQATINNIQYDSREYVLPLYDYGFIILDTDLGEITNWLKLKVPSDEELTNADMMVIGRGGDKPFLSLWESPGKIGKVENHYIYHNANTVSGNSGSPVFKEGDPENIIAIDDFEYKHAGKIRASLGLTVYPNGALRIRQEMIDTLNGLQGSFHW